MFQKYFQRAFDGRSGRARDHGVLAMRVFTIPIYELRQSTYDYYEADREQARSYSYIRP